ncbi:alpha/beta-hydrolase [Mycena olivaceomarginata]|nr:alpha/beta-hydrolase [Mycena olivaceomarginata]
MTRTRTLLMHRMAGFIRDENLGAPVVIVQGFLGTNAAWIWGNFDHYLNFDCKFPRRTIFVSVGPVSSLHDRACELYYALMGGTDTISEGQYPEWSPTRPLHFVAHSIGGPTVIKLLHLIKQGHFGPSAHAQMILSINAISAPFRGTQLVYLLGERADAAPAVRPLSFGSILGKWVHILSYMAPLLPQAVDFHGDCRSLTYRDISFFSLLKQLWTSDWAESRDAAPFDVSCQAVDERESDGEGVIDPNVFYQSHVAVMTRRRSESVKFHIPALSHIASPLMYISSRLVGKFDFSTLRPSPSFLAQRGDSNCAAQYWANDGVVPVFSQWHPLPCRLTRCRHLVDEEDAHHMSLVPLWIGIDRQKQWWRRLGQWLASVEESR